MVFMSKNQQKRRYTPKERESSLALAEKIGPAEAARKLGIPEGTVTMWRYMAKKAKTSSVSPAESAPVQATENSPKKVVANSYKPSMRAQVLEYAAEHGVTAAASKFGTTRFSSYTPAGAILRLFSPTFGRSSLRYFRQGGLCLLFRKRELF